MTADRSRAQDMTTGTAHHGARAASNQRLIGIAERELERALMEQERPTLGMSVHPSIAEHAAVERAIRAICGEAHRLDLRAEELLIDIKQAWSQLAAVRAFHLGDRDGDLLNAVVSSSIEVFFEARDMQMRESHD
jgi:hypothetical protein